MVKRQLQLPGNRSFFLFGPRQTGKSALLTRSFPQTAALYYNLLKTDEYLRLSANPSLFREEVMARKSRQTHIVVDDIQRVPLLLNEIHLILESPNPPVFCMSGSSARKLKRSHANLLAGRAWTFRLYPFTHRECGAGFSIQRALCRGTLPSVYLEEDDVAADRTLTAYVGTYLEEEIRAEAIVRNIGGFLRFIKLAANENGNIINYSTIARETGTSYHTIKEYFQVLEDTLIGFFLLPYHRAYRKRLVRHPKFYFFDTGVQRAIGGRSSLPLARGTSEYGRAFEHFLIAEIMRMADYSEKKLVFSFYRTESGAEVDLIIETTRGDVYALEIKSRENPVPADYSGLASFCEHQPEAVPCCVCLAPRRRLSGNVHILPWQEIFDFLGI